MICQSCEGEGYAKLSVPCFECNGFGIVSCCDAAGSAGNEPRAACAACGAEMPFGQIRCSACGKPFVFPDPPDPYHDARFVERQCDHCGKPYRGPAVYCSISCALADA